MSPALQAGVHRLLGKIERAGEEGLRRTQISSEVFQRNTPSSEIDRALQLLIREGRIIRERAETKGRPQKRYRSRGLPEESSTPAHGSGNAFVESIRRMVERDEGGAFLPKMCVEDELRQGRLREIRVEELQIEDNIRLIHPRRRRLIHAARGFFDLLDVARS